MKDSSRKIALCGIFGALALVVMLAGEIIPLATFCCPVLAMFLLVPILLECGSKMAFVWYVAVSLLSLILTSANPEAAMIFVCLGYYPLLRKKIGRIKPSLLRIATKLVLFNGSTAAAYAVLIWLFRLDVLVQELRQTTIVLGVVTILLANACFFLTERVLERFEVYYIVFLRKKLFRK